MSSKEYNIEVVEGERCPFCLQKTLTLRQAERDIPYFGGVLIFSMDCQNPDCNYFKADIEAVDEKDPVNCSFDVESEEDLKVRVVKSSNATVKISRVGSIEPGEASNGYVTNVEGVLSRMKKQIEQIRDTTDDDSEKKKAKNLIKKLQKVLWGQEKITIQLDDPTGNSMIVSDKTKVK